MAAFIKCSANQIRPKSPQNRVQLHADGNRWKIGEGSPDPERGCVGFPPPGSLEFAPKTGNAFDFDAAAQGRTGKRRILVPLDDIRPATG